MISKKMDYKMQVFLISAENNDDSNMNDVRILRHSNRICVITLSPSHPLIANAERHNIKSLSFKVCNYVYHLVKLSRFFSHYGGLPIKG